MGEGGLLAAGVLAGLILLLLARRSPGRTGPGTALAAYALLVPFGSELALPFGPSAFANASSLAGLGATAVFGVAALRTPRRAVVDPSVLGWLLLLAWLLLTWLWSIDRAQTADSLVVLGSLVLLHVLASLLPHTDDDLRLVRAAAVLGALVVAGSAVVTAATGRLGETSSRLPRFTFDEGDPNHTAAALLLALATCAAAALGGGRQRARWAGRLGAAAVLAGLALTGSRGGLLAGLVVLVVVVAAGAGRRPVAATATVVALVAAVGLAALLMPPELRSHLTSGDSTGRSAIWEVGAAACRTHCLVGSGYGTFGSAYREAWYDDLSLEGFGDRPWSAHNTLLAMAVEGGLPGLVLLMGSLGVLAVGVLRRRRGRDAAIAALAGLVVSGLLITNLGFKYWWLVVTYATLVAQHPVAGRPTAVVPGRRRRRRRALAQPVGQSV